MAKLRKAIAYSRPERPFTRMSKYKKLNYVRARPNIKVVRYSMGDTKKKFPYTYKLISKQGVQVRHNALEAARQSSNRLLEKGAGKDGYFFRIKVFPHHILRENPLASGAGADRMSTGMKKSFGKSIGTAAQVKKNQTVCEVGVEKVHIKVAKEALERVYHKLPGSYNLELVDNNKA